LTGTALAVSTAGIGVTMRTRWTDPLLIDGANQLPVPCRSTRVRSRGSSNGR